MVSEINSDKYSNAYFNKAKDVYSQEVKNIKNISIITFRAIKIYHCKPYPKTIETVVTNSDGTKSIEKRTLQIKFRKFEAKESVAYKIPEDGPQFKDEQFNQLIFADDMTKFTQEENACLAELQIRIEAKNNAGVLLKITTSGLCKDASHIFNGVSL